jgi:hypothetical protein
MSWRNWNKTSTEGQTGGRIKVVGPPVCFLQAIPGEIFSIKFVQPAPRTSPLKNVQVRASSQELLWRTLLGLYGVSLFAASMPNILGSLLRAGQNTILCMRANRPRFHTVAIPIQPTSTPRIPPRRTLNKPSGSSLNNSTASARS